MSIILNLFGESKRIFVCSIPNNEFLEYEKLRKSMALSQTEFYFDLEILENLGYGHWNKIPGIKQYNLFSLLKENKIEIKRKNKNLLKFKSHEIISDELLFPIFKSSASHFILPDEEGSKNIVFQQNEIGLFAKFELEIEKINIDLLDFKLIKFPFLEANYYLESIFYQNKKLTSINQDTLISGVRIIDC